MYRVEFIYPLFEVPESWDLNFKWRHCPSFLPPLLSINFVAAIVVVTLAIDPFMYMRNVTKGYGIRTCSSCCRQHGGTGILFIFHSWLVMNWIGASIRIMIRYLFCRWIFWCMSICRVDLVLRWMIWQHMDFYASHVVNCLLIAKCAWWIYRHFVYLQFTFYNKIRGRVEFPVNWWFSWMVRLFFLLCTCRPGRQALAFQNRSGLDSCNC